MDQNILKIQLNSDKNLVSRDATTERILEIRLHAPVSSKKDNRQPLNLALVLDRSGSMAGEKLEYVKQAACHVLDQLKEQDRVALVVYDDTIQLLAHSLNVTNSNRLELKKCILNIDSGNMTNLCDGWLVGCKEVAASAQQDSINRTLLLTDGLANVGVTDLESLAQHAVELYKDSVSTSAFGVGEGFNEHLLEAMANKGGGNFYYIASPDRIPDIFLKEFNDLVGITARLVEINLDLPRSIDWKILAGWSAEYIYGRLHIHVGDMLTGKLQDIYLKLQIPADDKSSEFILKVKVFGKGESGEVLEDQSQLSLGYAYQKDVDAAPEDKELMQRYTEVELADAATEALKLERQGERERASQILNENIRRNQPYLSHLQSATYQGMSKRMLNGMTEADRKLSHYTSYKIRRQKEKDEQEKQD